ncbi:tape measure protein [Nitratiruptor sp. SB155-2]|uniref:tape measure protein n=1 Tax=Nitratiruptor sp. (strain SB155-2) TaxID=387092 RepID=UPI0001586F5B|nr:tape measure protein [Nitratiruptor sp. SB155-2]BAF69590.1 hypothetical protein NIS_0476 [Nitratiruptor sp. SB155-2]BAN05352.1 tape measure protein [Nitratiruptor phage NrS-1]
MAKKELKLIIKTDAKTGDLKVFAGEVSKLDKATEKLSHTTAKSIKNIESFTKRIRDMAHIGVAIYALKQLADAAVALGGSFTGTAMEFEKFNAVLKTIEGSSQKAEKSMQWIVHFTKTTPYQLAETTEAFVKLRAYGLEPTKGLLKSLGDTAAAMGKPLDQAVEAIADAVNGEFERLKEFGIKAYNQGSKVAFQWADASGKVKHIVIDNNQEIIQSTLETIWNSKYEGAMNERANTLEGILSNIADNWTILKKNVMDAGLFNYIKSITKAIGDEFASAVDKSKTKAKEWSEWLINGIRFVAKAVVQMAYKWDVVVKAIKVLKIEWTAFKLAIVTAAAGFEKIFNGIRIGIAKAYNWIVDKAKAINNALPGFLKIGWIDNLQKMKVPQAFTAYEEESERLYKELKNQVQDYVDFANEKHNQLGDKFKEIFKRAEEYYKKFQSNVKTTTKKTTKEVKRAVDGAFQKTASKIKKTTKTTAKYIETTFDKVSTNIYDSFNNNFFDAITGKFKDFKSFLKSLFNDILGSIVNPFARSISASLAGFFTNGLASMVGLPQVSMNGVTIAKELTKAGWKALGDGVYQNEVGQKIVTTGGQIQAYAADGSPINDIATIASLPAALKTGSSALKGPGAALASAQLALMKPFSMAGQWLVGNGMTNAGLGVIGFGQGFAHPFTYVNLGTTAGTVGSIAGSALSGGLLGFGAGKLGDMLFGADTYAGIGGALGGAIGSGLVSAGLVSGPVGGIIAGIGTIIGGIFGKKKYTSQGIEAFDYVGASNITDETLKAYKHWEKEGWFSSSSGDEYSLVSQVVKNRLKKTFQALDEILLKVFQKEAEWTYLAPGKIWDKEDALEKTILSSFVQHITGKDIQSDEFTQQLKQIWIDYAESIDKTITETLTEEFGKYLKTRRDFSIWKAKIFGNDIEALRLKMEYAKEDLQSLQKAMDASNVTVDNYLDLMQKAIEASPTPDTIESWNQLGQALMQATDAERAYKQAIEQTITQGISRFESALAILNAKPIENVSQLLEAIANATPETVQNVLAAINNLKQKEIQDAQKSYNDRINQLNKEKSVIQNIARYLDQLRRGADRLRAIALRGTTYAKERFYEYLGRVRNDLANGLNPDKDVENLLNYASAYQEYLKQNSQTQKEYLFETNKMANLLDDMADRYDVKSNTDRIESAIVEANIDLQNRIGEINETYQRYTEMLKLTIEREYQSFVDKMIDQYAEYLGYDSPIVQQLIQLQNAIMAAIQDSQNKVASYQVLTAPSDSGGGGSEAYNLVYQTYMEVLGRPPDTDAAGWVEAVKSGDIAPQDLAKSIAYAATQVFDESSYNGDVPHEVIEESIKNAANYAILHPFADGGIVTAPTAALIGEAGYHEAVIPLKDPNDPLNQKTLISEIRALRREVAALKEYNKETANNTKVLQTDRRFA